jgi:hypothetical protein
MAVFKNLHIQRVTKISVGFTKQDWKLYDVEYANIAAARLNDTLSAHVNRGAEETAVREAMHRVMADHSEFGANDTEPRAFLEKVLDEIFKE